MSRSWSYARYFMIVFSSSACSTKTFLIPCCVLSLAYIDWRSSRSFETQFLISFYYAQRESLLSTAFDCWFVFLFFGFCIYFEAIFVDMRVFKSDSDKYRHLNPGDYEKQSWKQCGYIPPLPTWFAASTCLSPLSTSLPPGLSICLENFCFVAWWNTLGTGRSADNSVPIYRFGPW